MTLESILVVSRMNYKDINLHEKMLDTLVSRFEEVFIIDAFNDKPFTYEHFFGNVTLYIQVFKELGLKRQDKLMFILENSIDLVFLYFAGLLYDITLIPVDPQKGQNEIQKISEYESNAWILHDIKFDIQSNKMIELESFKSKLNFKLLEHFNKSDLMNEVSHIDLDRDYLVMFTSGTSGEPKGVVHSFRNLLTTALAFSDKFGFDSNNIFYQNMPMTYMAGFLNQMIIPFITGGKIIIGNRFSISEVMHFWKYPIKYGVNTFWFNPTMLSLLTKLDRSDEGVRYTKSKKIIGCVGTAPLYDEVKEHFESKYSITLYQSYGLSELLFISTNFPLKSQKENCVGDLLDGVEIKIAEDDEILVKVPWVFKGYTNLSTKPFFENEFYKTGDVGMLLEDNSLVIKDRKKDIIIRGGINLSPRNIELLLSDMHLFSDFAITSAKDQTIVEKIICYYVSENKITSEKMQINTELSSKLGSAYKIDEFILIDEIPKNINGKVDKKKLQELYEGYKNR